MGKQGSRELKEKQRARWLAAVAHHEAGHAIASFRRKRGIRHVTIVPAADYAGRVAHYKAPASFQAIDEGRLSNAQVEDRVLISLAGPEAERKFSGRYDHAGASSDHDWVVDLLMKHSGSAEEVNAWSKLMHLRARGFVEHHWEDIEAVAAALLERRTIKGSDVKRILQQRDEKRTAAFLERIGGPEALARATMTVVVDHGA
jgi:ATP-dependent Zn protease